jgi:sec-independent protein translocase protein TatC
MTKLKMSLVGGVLFSLPVLFTQLWLFVSPGLYARERRTVVPIVLISVLLFASGACFAYFLAIPFALKFFLGFQSESLRPLISIGSYLSFFLSLIFIFGITFDFPVVLIGLIYFGVVGTRFLDGQRKWVVVLIFLLAAVLTPTVDLITQCLLALPLWLLFEGSLLTGRWIEKRRDTSKSPLYT